MHRRKALSGALTIVGAISVALLSGAESAAGREAVALRGTVRYVAPTGSDSAPGTLDRPWRTVQRGLDSVRPGDTVVVRAGTYRENLAFTRSGSPGAPVTLRSFAGERAVLRPSASDPSYPLRIKNAYSRVQGFVIEGASASNTVNVYVTEDAHHATFAYCEVRNARRGSGIFVDHAAFRINIVGNTVHGNNEPGEQHQAIYYEASRGVVANNVVYGQTNGFGIQLRTDASSGPTDVLVSNNTVTGNSLGGIVVEHPAVRLTIVNNIAAYNGGTGIRGYFADEDHPDDSAGVGNVVHHNLVFGNRGHGNLHSDAITTGPSSGRRILAFGRNLVGNPRFVSLAQADFHLRAGSPALGRSVRKHTPPRDRDGRLRRSRASLDLGAFERSS